VPEKPPQFGGSRLAQQLYCKGIGEATSAEVLKEHVNDALQRALRPGEYVEGVYFVGSPSGGTRNAILVITSDALADAALGLSNMLLCEGHRLSLKRPQGWSASEQRAVDALPKPSLTIVREEEGVELAPILSVEERLRMQRLERAKASGVLPPRGEGGGPFGFPPATSGGGGRPAYHLQPAPAAAKKKKVEKVAPTFSPSQQALLDRLKPKLNKTTLGVLNGLCTHKDEAGTQIDYNDMGKLLDLLMSEGLLHVTHKDSSMVITSGSNEGGISHSIKVRAGVSAAAAAAAAVCARRSGSCGGPFSPPGASS